MAPKSVRVANVLLDACLIMGVSAPSALHACGRPVGPGSAGGAPAVHHAGRDCPSGQPDTGFRRGLHHLTGAVVGVRGDFH
jgi:hypothetical protein